MATFRNKIFEQKTGRKPQEEESQETAQRGQSSQVPAGIRNGYNAFLGAMQRSTGPTPYNAPKAPQPVTNARGQVMGTTGKSTRRTVAAGSDELKQMGHMYAAYKQYSDYQKILEAQAAGDEYAREAEKAKAEGRLGDMYRALAGGAQSSATVGGITNRYANTQQAKADKEANAFRTETQRAISRITALSGLPEADQLSPEEMTDWYLKHYDELGAAYKTDQTEDIYGRWKASQDAAGEIGRSYDLNPVLDEADMYNAMATVEDMPQNIRELMDMYAQGYDRQGSAGMRANSAKYQLEQYLGEQGEEDTDKALRDLTTWYNRYNNMVQAQEISEKAKAEVEAGTGSALGANVKALGASFVGGAAGATAAANDALSHLWGQNPARTADPYAEGQALNVYANSVKQYTGESIDNKVLKTLYNAGMSTMENGSRILATSLLGVPEASLGLMAVGAYGQSYQEAALRGGDPMQATMFAAASAGLEVLTEKVSLDNLLNAKSPDTIIDLLKNAAVQGAVEVSEEEASFVGGIIADALIMGDKAEIAMRLQELLDSGMTEQDAYNIILGEQLMDAAKTAAESWLSGAMMGGVETVADYSGNRSIGSDIVRSSDAMQNLMQAAQAMPEDTAAYQRAQKQKSDPAYWGALLRDTAGAEIERSNAIQEIGRADTDSEAEQLYGQFVSRYGEGSAQQAREVKETRQRINTYDANNYIGDVMHQDAISDSVVDNIRTRESYRKAFEEATGEDIKGKTEQEQRESIRSIWNEYRESHIEEIKADNTGTVTAEASTLGEEGRKTLASVNDGTKPGMALSREFKRYYTAGQIGQEISQVRISGRSILTQEQQQAAWNAGQADQKTSDSFAKQGIRLQHKRKDAGFQTKGVNLSKLGVDQQTANTMNRVGKALGVRINMEALPEGQNGKIERDGTLTISTNAAHPVQVVLAHEITHRIQDLAPGTYKAYRDYVVGAIARDSGSTIDSIIGKHIDRYSRGGVRITNEQAMDEIAADYAMRMMENVDLFKDFVRQKDGQKHGTRLLEALKNAIRRLLGKDKPTPAQLKAWGTDLQTMQKAAELWEQALTEARQTNKWLKTATAGKLENLDVTDGAYAEGPDGTRYSLKSLQHDVDDGRMFLDLERVCGMSHAEAMALKTNLNDLIEYMAPDRDILDMNEAYGREDWKFAPYKPNSDPLYKISLDFSTLCSKRLLTQFVIENLQLQHNRAMSAEEQMAIRSMLNDYRKQEKGLQVACAMCYVEAARLKSPNQMQRWFDDPAERMRDYFAANNRDFKAAINEAQADFKEEHGYKRDDPKSAMSNKDRTALNKIGPEMRKSYHPSAEEQAIMDRAAGLERSNYLTAGNLANLSQSEPEIYKAYTTFIRNATRSKALETDEPYYYGDSTRDNGNGIVVTDTFIENVNRENGMRFSSWSDWRIQHMLDYITAVIDMSVRGAAMHGYTKFPAEVRVLGKTGMMFNLSGVANGNSGLTADGKLDFSPTESIDIEQAKNLREEFPETAGLQCIGISVEHIKVLLASPIIDYVIPYHTSGLNADLRRMAGIYGWKNFTKTQNASVDKSISEKGDGVDLEHWHQEPVWSEFFVGYKTGKSGIEAMRESAERYKKMCRERGMTPKFIQFANEDNYWKLLIDRKMINQQTGELIEQKPVKPNFDFELIKSIVDDHVQNYDSGLEARALKYIQDNWDQVQPKIKELKAKKKAAKKGGKNAATQAMETIANEMIAAIPSSEADGRKYSLEDYAHEGWYDYSKSFAEQLQDWKDGKIPKNDSLVVGHTPEVFRKIGLGALPVTINQRHIDYALNGTKDFDHELGQNLMNQLPEAIKNPVAVFVSRSKFGTSIVALLEIRHNAKNVVTPVVVDGFGTENGLRIDSNAITSVYGKNYSISKVLNGEIEKHNDGQFSLLYLDEEKTTALFRGARVPMPKMPETSGGFIHSIADPGSPVKAKVSGQTETLQFKRWFGDWRNHPDTIAKGLLNADGTPKVFYRGDVERRDIIRPDYRGAIWATDNVDYAHQRGSEAQPMYVSMKNPYYATVQVGTLSSPYDIDETIRKARSEGKDGAIISFVFTPSERKMAPENWYAQHAPETPASEVIPNSLARNGETIGEYMERAKKGPVETHTAVWESGQYKNADDNIGTFDRNNPNTRFSIESSLETAEEEAVVAPVLKAMEALQNAAKERDDAYAELVKMKANNAVKGAEAAQRYNALKKEVLAANSQIQELNRTLGKATAEAMAYAREHRQTQKMVKELKAEVQQLQADAREVGKTAESWKAAYQKAAGQAAAAQERFGQKIAEERSRTQKAKEATAQAKADSREALKKARMEKQEALRQQATTFNAEKAVALADAAQDRLAREKELKQRLKDQRAQQKETADRDRYRSRVEKSVATLTKAITRPTPDLHVPSSLQTPIRNLLNSLDFSSDRLNNGGEATIKDIAYTRALQGVANAVTAQQAALDKGEGAYSLDLPPEFVQEINRHIQHINDATEGLDVTTDRVYDMTADELRDLEHILSTITKAVRDIDILHMAGAKARVSELAKQTVYEDMPSRKATKTEKGNEAIWAYYTPTYAFERMGKGATQILDGLKQGQTKLARTVSEIIEFSEETYTGDEVKEWENDRISITLESGEQITMSSAQIMSFAMLANREQAAGHMGGGGIRISTIGEGRKALVQKAHYNLTANDIMNISGKLTDHQREVAGKLQKYMADFGGRLGNEVTMARWDYTAFTEDNYFPIATDAEIRDARNPDQEKANLWALVNKSFTKALVQNANNAIVVSSIFDVFAQHMSDMAEYNAFALPLVDAMKWFNYRETEDGENEGQIKTWGTQKALNDTLGTSAGKYFIDLMTDINSSQKAGRYENMLGKLMSRFKGASVGWNLRVAAQQPTAILRASVMIEGKYLLQGTARIGTKALNEEMLKYSGIALWKSLGYYDLNVGRSVTEQIKRDRSLMDKINDAGMWLPGKMDEITWARIWAACKAKVKAEQKLSGEELLQETAKLFDDVCYHTQVADSVLTRNSLMRSKSQAVKELTAFMAEPTMSINILMNAASDYQQLTKHKGKAAAWGKTKTAIMIGIQGYVLSSALNALVTSAMDAFRDDDDYENWLDKFKQALLGNGKFTDGNLFGELDPLEKIVVIKDILSYFKGYDNTASYMQAVKALKDSYDAIVNLINGKGSITEYGAVYKSFQALGYVTGGAWSNAMREIASIWNSTVGVAYPNLKLHRYKTKTETAIKNSYTSGILSFDEAVQYLVDDADMSKDDAVKKAYGWTDKLNGGDLSDSAAYAYYAIAEPAGIDYEVYVDAVNAKKGFSGEVKEQVVKYIMALNLTKPQKKALWNALKGSWKDKGTPWE